MWEALMVASMLVLAPGWCGGGPPAGLPPAGAPAAQPGLPDGGAPLADTGVAAGRDPPSCVFGRLDAGVSLDEPSNTMRAAVRISLQTGRDTSWLVFRLRTAMTVQAVTEEGGGPLEFTRPFWYFYNVSLGREVPAGTALNITVDYYGPVLNTPDGGQSYWDYVGPEGSWVRTFGDYFPSDENRTRTPGRLAVTAPADRTTVSSGSLLGRTEDAANGTATTVWENARPVIGLSFLCGNLTRSGYDLGGHRYDLYFRPDHADVAASYAAEMARATAFYTAQFGEPGFGDLAVAEVPGLYAAWGQTTPSMVWLSSRNFDGALPYRILSHEVAHQWWGIDVEGEGAGENFLQEGFAGYSEAMYEIACWGSRGYLDYCRQEYINRFVHGAGPEPVLASNDYDLSSFKGPWVLHMFRYLVGDEAFNRTLLAFHRDRYGGRADMSAFQDEALAATGRDLSEFFYMWLYSSGRLDYAVADAVVLRGPAGIDRVQVAVENSGALGGLPLDLGIYFEGGLRGSVPAAWNGSGQNITLGHDVGYPVDAVRLDPFNWLLDAYPSNNEAPTRDGFIDVAVAGVAAAPAVPVEGQDIIVTAEVALNTTEGPMQVGFELLVDGAPNQSAGVVLEPGGRAEVNFTLRLGPGDHLLTAVADPQNRLFEKDVLDNRASLLLSVAPLPPVLPDVAILPGGISVTPAGVAGGRPAAIEVRLANLGPVAAPGVRVDVWVDSLETGYAGRSGELALGPGETAQARLDWTAVSGWHQLTARAVLPPGLNDSDPRNDEATAQVYVNSPPTALLTASAQQARVGEIVDFSGALSVDDSRVAGFLFDFGDGEETGWLADNATFHAYQARGTYQARLLVQDDTGAGSDWSAPAVIRVSSPPPVAAIRGPALRLADVLTSLRFVSASTGPDGDTAALAWSFGDGATASGPQANHTYSRKGVFTVTLSATDGEGQFSSASVRVSVLDLPPVPAISYDGKPARVGQRVGFDSAGTADPDDPPSALGCIWDFGGGQKAAGASASYAFVGPGWHRVTLTASDGNLSAQTFVDVEVRAAAPAEPGPAAGALSWAVLGLLLLAMAGLAAFIMFPFKAGKDEEEE